MSKGNSCILVPETESGKPSRLYKDLLKYVGKDMGRAFVNFIYASYKVDIKNKMLSSNIPLKEEEHNYKDVLKFIEYKKLLTEVSDIKLEEVRRGFADINGNRTDFTDALEALQKADEFNKEQHRYTAIVVKHDNIYNIITAQKDSHTNTYANDVESRIKSWEVYKQVFNSVGINFEDIPEEVKKVVSAYNTDLVQILKNLRASTIDRLYKDDALLLFALNKDIDSVQRVINAFGSIEEAATALYEHTSGIRTLTSSQQHLLQMAVMNAKKFKNLNLNALANQISQVAEDVRISNPEEAIQRELHKLNKKYRIDKREIIRTTQSIKTLSDAAAEAVIVVKRKLEKLKYNGDTNNSSSTNSIEEEKKLSNIMEYLLRELQQKRYSASIYRFLQESAISVSNFEDKLNSIKLTSNDFENAVQTSKIIQELKEIKDSIFPLVDALSDGELIIDESIGTTDIENIKKEATKLKDILSKYDRKLYNISELTMIDLVHHALGQDTIDGRTIADVVAMASKQPSFLGGAFSLLYDIGKASDPLITSMGAIMKNAERKRNAMLNEIAKRIRIEEDKLNKAGENSAFMYENNGYLVSDIDWDKYNNAKNAKYHSLLQSKYTGFDLTMALKEWEDQNTEDRVVDTVTGRTEKVPNESYRKQSNFRAEWTEAQNNYYDAMMQLKGEIGSLLPEYARKQYLAPQVRRQFLESTNVKEAAKAILNKIENIYTIREDDREYVQNGIIGDEYSQISAGNFDNTALQTIPIFFINKVADTDLLKNFSTGLQALASSAVSFNAMNEIKDTVEFMGDFIKSKDSIEAESKVEAVENRGIRIFKTLFSRSKKNPYTSALVDGYINQHIYMQHTTNSKHPLFQKLLKSILSYTSFLNLSTNVHGYVNNALMGEFQMLREAFTGEFYNFGDYLQAHAQLFGKGGAVGDIAELLTNNVSHKSVLLRQMFDPKGDDYEKQSNTRYYGSIFRQLLSHDLSFAGYEMGEYMIHYVNMYSVLNHTKVLLNGKKINLYDAFEVGNKENGNADLIIKEGVTDLDGNDITPEFLKEVGRTIKYVNESCHGGMSQENKGIFTQYMAGKCIMQFRQWMIEHYSLRFRERHHDAALKKEREGFWRTYINTYIYDNNLKSAFEDSKYSDSKGWDRTKITGKVALNILKELPKLAIPRFIWDYGIFSLKAQAKWDSLEEDQKYNVKRVHAEVSNLVLLLLLSFAMGDLEDHEDEPFYRFWMYQVRRAILEEEATMPLPNSIKSALTMLNSPMASINSVTGLLDLMSNGIFYIGEEYETGKYAGENKFVHKASRYIPGVKDYEKLMNMGSDDSMFNYLEK